MSDSRSTPPDFDDPPVRRNLGSQVLDGRHRMAAALIASRFRKSFINLLSGAAGSGRGLTELQISLCLRKQKHPEQSADEPARRVGVGETLQPADVDDEGSAR